jgi:hypothetical protein
MNESAPASFKTAAPPQFGMAALLWTTAAIAMALAYLRWYGAEACVAGFEIAGVSLLIGLAIGKASGQVMAGIFWSVVGAMFGFLSAAGAPLVDPALRYAWALVGCAAAAAVAVAWPQKLLRSLAIGAAAGGLAMLAAVAIALASGIVPLGADVRFDALCAPLAGAWMGLAVFAVEWAERRTPTPRYVAGAGLILAVIAGNVAGAAIFPWWT